MNSFFYTTAALSALTAGALVRSQYERKHFETAVCTVWSSMLPRSFDGFRIVFLSDLHNNSFGENNERLLTAVDSLRPDLAAVGGDMTVAKGLKNQEVSLRLVRALAGRYPVYYGLGNHERRMNRERELYEDQYDRYMDSLKEAGVHILKNCSRYLERRGERIRISGLDLARKYYKKAGKRPMEKGYLEKVLGEGPGKEYHILLAHSPLYFREYVRWGADLVLSGHFHGGTIRLPVLGGVMTPDYMFFPEYDRGLYYERQSAMIVSAGLGTHSVNIRLNNRPQLILVQLRARF